MDRLFCGRARLRRQRGAAERARPAEQRSIEPARGSARRADARFRAAGRCASMRARTPFTIPTSAISIRPRFGCRSRPSSGSGSGRSSSARRWGAARSMATGSRSSSAPTYDCAVASASGFVFEARAIYDDVQCRRSALRLHRRLSRSCFGYRCSTRVRLAFAPVTTSSTMTARIPAYRRRRERWSVVYQRPLVGDLDRGRGVRASHEPLQCGKRAARGAVARALVRGAARAPRQLDTRRRVPMVRQRLDGR